ncbi:class F sortase [Micromonospora sp. WMMD558]|uniref:class F sortase n=1 Tax=unclassified Micromonospora TaxID=2617518 RepID=UPI0012B4CB4C|nr:class F sortase [Micromonospora sp. WMMC415]QGN48971.1 class F sortase [Micromonospora sp. WMMC415]
MALPPEAARSASGRHGFPWRAAGFSLVVLVILTGAGLVGLAATAPDPVGPPPQPDPAAAPEFLLSPPSDQPTTAAAPTPSGTSASPSTGATPGAPRRARGSAATRPSPAPTVVGMVRSQPTRIKIPRIGVDAPTVPLGLDRNQQIAVPPLNQPRTTGWYKLGPTPGEVGTAVVVGHVDSRVSGRAVFFRLGALKPKDTIEVLRQDGKNATFVVDGVARYPKAKLPLNQVYGHTGKAQLRLITCGGTYDKAAKSYRDNIVVFATLTTGRAT